MDKYAEIYDKVRLQFKDVIFKSISIKRSTDRINVTALIIEIFSQQIRILAIGQRRKHFEGQTELWG